MLKPIVLRNNFVVKVIPFWWIDRFINQHLFYCPYLIFQCNTSFLNTFKCTKFLLTPSLHVSNIKNYASISHGWFSFSSLQGFFYVSHASQRLYNEPFNKTEKNASIKMQSQILPCIPLNCLCKLSVIISSFKTTNTHIHQYIQYD